MNTLAYADIVMEVDKHRVTRDGNFIHPGPTTFRIVRALLERPENVCSREALVERVWGPNVFIDPRTVDVQILRLRRALNVGGRPDIVRTVRGSGYALDRETSKAHVQM
jgi:two-component system, OmpR family, phosphate regulon response regulator PhoB